MIAAWNISLTSWFVFGLIVIMALLGAIGISIHFWYQERRGK